MAALPSYTLPCISRGNNSPVEHRTKQKEASWTVEEAKRKALEVTMTVCSFFTIHDHDKAEEIQLTNGKEINTTKIYDCE